MREFKFPPSPLEALKFHQMNLPFVHRRLSEDGLRQALKIKGDFLVMIDDKDSVTIAANCGEGGIVEIPLQTSIAGDDTTPGFAIAGWTFRNLKSLVWSYAQRKNLITTDREQFRLGVPVCRGNYSGRFGHGEIVKLVGNFEERVFMRSLTDELTCRKTLEDDLEELVCIRHKYLNRYRDYRVYDMGPITPPIVLLFSDAYDRNLYQYLVSMDGVLPTVRYVSWSYQAAKALNYLMDQGIYHRRLCPRCCLVDGRDKLKISDFWTDNDVDDCEFFQAFGGFERSSVLRRDGWRCLPVESLRDGMFGSASQMWSFGCLVWHIFTHCRFLCRAQYSSLADFIDGSFVDDPFFLPGNFKKQELTESNEVRVIAFVKASDHFPRAPESFNDRIRRALHHKPDMRPTWTELLPSFCKEYRIFRLSSMISNIMHLTR